MPQKSQPQIVLASVGRFHYGTLAQELWRGGNLVNFYSGFIRKQLRCPELPRHVIRSYPWWQLPLSVAERFNLIQGRPLQIWMRRAQISVDQYIARTLPDCDVYAALSGCGVESGAEAKRRGIRTICERGSDHIRDADQQLAAEFDRWNIHYHSTDLQTIEREEQEYQQADRIILISSASQRSFQRSGVSKHKLHIVPPAINPSLFHSKIPPKTNHPKHLRLMFIGNLSVNKGLGHLLHAFQKAAPSNAQLRIAGRRMPETAALLSGIDTRRVHFLGHQTQQALTKELNQADVLLVPSISDGLPMVALEALACGCPVIISDSAGAADYIQHGENGLIIASGDTDALAASIQRISDEKDLLKTLRAGVQRVKISSDTAASYGQRWLKAVS